RRDDPCKFRCTSLASHRCFSPATAIRRGDDVMSQAPLIRAIQEQLRAGGYQDVATPFRVAGVGFEFTAAMRGQGGRALDLILLIDTTTGDFGDRDADRIRQRVEALSRALDLTESRFVITVILAGAPLLGNLETLAETCRVLYVE